MSQTKTQLVDFSAVSISFGAGTAAAPSVYYSADSTTGVYFPSTGQVALSTSGTGRLFVSSAGNVGINNASPSFKFDVDGTFRIANGTNPYVALYNGSNTAYLQIASGDLNLAAPTGGNTTFSTSGSERVRINTSGAIGLGGANYGTSGQVLTSAGSAGTPTWTTVAGGGGDVILAANNAFTGANTFTNTTGQVIRKAATQDGITLTGRAGGTTSLSVSITPTTLTANRTLTLPDTTGTLITTGDTGTVSNTMLATISTAGKVSGSSITSGNITTSGNISAPAFLPTGSAIPTLGLFSPSANVVSISTNSIERFRVGASGDLSIGGASNTGTTGQVFKSGGSGAAPTWDSPVTRGSPISASLQTEIAYTSIPSWVSEITIILNTLSTNNNREIFLQIGNSGGYLTSGYSSVATNTSSANRTDAMILTQNSSNTDNWTGIVKLVSYSSSLWVYSSVLTKPSNIAVLGGGYGAITGPLDRIRLVSSGGTAGPGDAFDNGGVNIFYA